VHCAKQPPHGQWKSRRSPAEQAAALRCASTCGQCGGSASCAPNRCAKRRRRCQPGAGGAVVAAPVLARSAGPRSCTLRFLRKRSAAGLLSIMSLCPVPSLPSTSRCQSPPVLPEPEFPLAVRRTQFAGTKSERASQASV